MKDTLKKAVIEQLGHDDETNEELIGVLNDIRNHGANGGFCGFIYYSDTIKFFDDNRSDILEMASEIAQEFGQSISEMICGFNCMSLTEPDIQNFLIGLTVDDDIATELKNALAWFACEEVARSFES